MKSKRRLLIAILAISVLVRAILAERGGQRWWPDENRFGTSIDCVTALREGHPYLALATLFGSAEHLGFRILGVIPAAGLALGLPDWTAAFFFGLFSVGVIWQAGRLALLSGANEETALWASFFAAAAVSLFYYSRHYFPYDASLCFILAAMIYGLPRPGIFAAFLAGLWGGAAFVTYSGYWLAVAVAMAYVVLLPAARDWRRILLRGLAGLAGVLLPAAAAVGIGALLGRNLMASFIQFSGTVTLGAFAESWTFPWEYFWHSEHLMLLFWAAAFAAAITGAIRFQRRFLLTWCIWIALVYLGLGIFGEVLHKFVVYGRIVRCLTPLFALVCAGGMAALGRWVRGGRWAQAAVAVAVAAVAAVNFRQPLAQWYPDRFYARARAIERSQPEAFFRVLNANFFCAPIFLQDPPIARTVFARPNPMQYEPFLYENQAPWDRQKYRAHDLTMRLVVLRPDARWPLVHGPGMGGYPGPTRVILMLPGPGVEGGKPLVVTGKSDACDFLNVARAGPGRYRFRYDHCFGGGPTSVPMVLEEGSPHTLEISLGSMLPPESAPEFRKHPEWKPLRHRLLLRVDGKVVFDQAANYYPAEADEVNFGHNPLGGSTTDPDYPTPFLAVEPIADVAHLK